MAVEAALMAALLLAPLLSGVLYWGNYFWQAQRVATSDVTTIPQGSVAGRYSCAELTDRVKALVGDNLSALARQLGLPTGTIDVAVSAVRVLPDMGADVTLSVRVPVADQVASLLPLPGGGTVVQEATERLTNVKVTTTSCA